MPPFFDAHHCLVIPANAGTQSKVREALGPRVRGDDDYFIEMDR